MTVVLQCHYRRGWHTKFKILVDAILYAFGNSILTPVSPLYRSTIFTCWQQKALENSRMMKKNNTCTCVRLLFFVFLRRPCAFSPFHCQQTKPYQFAWLSVLTICLRLDEYMSVCRNVHSNNSPRSTSFDHFNSLLLCHPQSCLTSCSEFERQHV